jgi:hypothetical protein
LFGTMPVAASRLANASFMGTLCCADCVHRSYRRPAEKFHYRPRLSNQERALCGLLVRRRNRSKAATIAVQWILLVAGGV